MSPLDQKYLYMIIEKERMAKGSKGDYSRIKLRDLYPNEKKPYLRLGTLAELAEQVTQSMLFDRGYTWHLVCFYILTPSSEILNAVGKGIVPDIEIHPVAELPLVSFELGQ